MLCTDAVEMGIEILMTQAVPGRVGSEEVGAFDHHDHLVDFGSTGRFVRIILRYHDISAFRFRVVRAKRLLTDGPFL